ncbi:MAG TPA: uroporphyrinogen-III C-methyltransferase [Pelomicrobium sp.]|nr:uroporphyrinogen-III C-methyltransferase [Pelomicrobium sp.]
MSDEQKKDDRPADEAAEPAQDTAPAAAAEGRGGAPSDSSEPTGAAETEAAAPPSRGTPWYLQPALFLALAALGFAGWHYWQTRATSESLRLELASRLATFEKTVDETRRDIDRLDNSVRDITGKLGAVDSRVAEIRSQQVALEQIYQDLSKSRDEAVLADAEQLVSIASQQLALAGNVKAALAALQGADQRLAKLDRPQLAPARKAIAADIAKLEAVPHVDTTGLSARLDALAERVAGLPLAAEARPAASAPPPAQPPTGSAWRDLLAAAWRDLRALVRIRKIDAAEAPLLAPDQSYFLREQLRLRLLSARLALLNRDPGVYRRDLATAEDWLKRYFNVESPEVKAALEEVRELREATVSVQLPNIEDSLTAVRGIRLTRAQGAE